MARRTQGGTNLMISMLLSLGEERARVFKNSLEQDLEAYGLSTTYPASSSSQPDAFNIHLRWICKLLKRGENKVKGCR